MSQSIALENHALLPNLITDEQPAGCFTKYPSKTLYSVAMEEADTKEKGVLQKFKEFIIDMFRRIANWLKSFISKDEAKKLATEEIRRKQLSKQKNQCRKQKRLVKRC